MIIFNDRNYISKIEINYLLLDLACSRRYENDESSSFFDNSSLLEKIEGLESIQPSGSVQPWSENKLKEVKK